MVDLYENVISAIKMIYDISVSNEQRAAASKMIEEMKEKVPDEVESLAFKLSSSDDELIAHNGWNIIEHLIRFKWLEMRPETRLKIRNDCLAHLMSNTLVNSHVRNAACRCIVDMIEHEWPQNWPELFDQLSEIESVSIVHAQLPFVILQRLVEDVVTMPSVPNAERRRDLNNAISLQLPAIFEKSVNVLNQCVILSSGESIELIKSVLSLLSEIVEWASASVIDQNLDLILTPLCAFLNTADYSINEQAAKCLLHLASRKRVKNDESSIVLTLFGDVPMQAILTSASAAASVGAENVQHYRCLKVLCDVLVALGLHLKDVWQRRPPNFALYLSAIENFLTHPSIYLRSEAASVFSAFSSHPTISQDELFIEVVNRVIPLIPSLLERKGAPSEGGTSVIGQYSLLDYNDDSEFMRDVVQLCDRLRRVIRQCLNEENVSLFFTVIDNWIKTSCIGNTLEVRETEWVAMQTFVRHVLSVCDENKLLTQHQKGILANRFSELVDIINHCDKISAVNSAMSILSSLFIILSDFPHLVSLFLTMARKILTNTKEGEEDVSTKRHCIALLLRLVTTFAEAVKSEAQQILDLCLSVSPSLSPMQRASCLHVLAALSNLCSDFATQQNFLSCALEDCVSFFKSPELIRSVQSDAEFLSYIGFTSCAPSNIDEAKQSSFVTNRRFLRSCLFALEGTLANVVSCQGLKHPAFLTLSSVLPVLFNIAIRVKSLYKPETLSLIHPSYGQSVLEITAADRQQLLCAIDPLAPSTSRQNAEDAVTHARAFVSDITEHIQIFTGYCGSQMGHEFYIDSRAGEWMKTVVCDIAYAPDFRLRYWIRRSWRSLICSCPASQFTVVRDMLQLALNEVYTRLCSRWETIENFEQTDDEPSLEQLFLEHMICVLTRESITFVRAILNLSENSSSGVDENKEKPICCITNHVLQDQNLMSFLVAIIFRSFTCRDTNSAIRAIPAGREILNSIGDKCNEKVGSFMLIHCIKGLQVHGSDEVACGPLLSLVFHTYLTLRKRFESVIHILEEIPGCNLDALRDFDNKILGTTGSDEVTAEKMKREMMRKILRPIIATTASVQFKRPAQLRSLQPMYKKEKIVEEEDFTALGLIFN
ncbi:hypothetical protein AB6A40_001643 [Gnathostoma spinigerum]|uniref:Exportin 5 n=1 Tax=Gnathostoma spinigerum TaxID=75299 RepID=A0ABD6E9W1_9BILA